MRVIAGTHGGRPLKAPRGSAVRPTSDRVREALFSILGESVAGARVLDLFAGTGALGIEALSRGAASATFVDTEPRTVRANLESLGMEAQVQRADAVSWLRRAGAGGGIEYDLAFLDPPYRLAERIGRKLVEALPPVLAPGAVVVSESSRRDPLDLDPLNLIDERRYGDTLIRIHAA